MAPVLSFGNTWPVRPITWVVPFPPGGITDTTSRQIAKRASEILGQSIVVENRAGAGGSLGTESVLRAAPDGYTVLYGTQGTMAANLALYKNLKDDPLRDFVPVQALFASPTVLAVETSKPFNSVADLIRFAKDNPGKLNYGSAGSGTATHLTGELFQTETGTQMVHVPYKGSSPALQDLLGGRLDLMFDYTAILAPHIRSGKLKPLAVMSRDRVEMLNGVPSIVEAGFPGAISTAWSGMMMPVGTPAEVVNRFAEAIRAALVDPAVSQPFVASGSILLSDVRLGSFRDFILAEQKKWAEVVRKSGATLS
jgi:tripartite-type tricarboxylate transporter receptor subunit TctC